MENESKKGEEMNKPRSRLLLMKDRLKSQRKLSHGDKLTKTEDKVSKSGERKKSSSKVSKSHSFTEADKPNGLSSKYCLSYIEKLLLTPQPIRFCGIVFIYGYWLDRCTTEKVLSGLYLRSREVLRILLLGSDIGWYYYGVTLTFDPAVITLIFYNLV